MSTPNYWIGNAPATTHTFTLTFTGTATGSGNATVTINGKSVAFPYVSTNTAIAIATGLQALLAASTIPEFQEVVWTIVSNVITGTATQSQLPITYTAGTTGGTTTAVASVDTVSPTGPSWISNAANWSLGLPVSGQQCIIASGPSILYGIGSPGFASAPDSFRIFKSFTNQIGLPDTQTNSNGTSYQQYRPTFLAPVSAVVTVGEGNGAGSALIRLGCYNAGTIQVYGTASAPSNATQSPVQVMAVTGNTLSSLQVYSGSVQYGGSPNSFATSTVTSAVVNGKNASLTIYDGHTFTSLSLTGGSVSTRGTTTTLSQSGGTYTQNAGQVNTIVSNGGAIILNHTQTSPAIVAQLTSLGTKPPSLDCSQTANAKALSSSSYFKNGSSLNDPYESTSLTTVTFDAPSIANSNIGPSFTITR
jgi:hypothetical protein